jgi:hypothetical protein
MLNLRERIGGGHNVNAQISDFSLWGPWAAGLERHYVKLRFGVTYPNLRAGSTKLWVSRLDWTALAPVATPKFQQAAALAWRLLGGPRAHNTTQ